MTVPSNGTGPLGRGAKRFLSPRGTYEIWLALVRGGDTISQAADPKRTAICAIGNRSAPGSPRRSTRTLLCITAMHNSRLTSPPRANPLLCITGMLI